MLCGKDLIIASNGISNEPLLLFLGSTCFRPWSKKGKGKVADKPCVFFDSPESQVILLNISSLVSLRRTFHPVGTLARKIS